MRRTIRTVLAAAILAGCLTVASATTPVQAATGDCQISAPASAYRQQVELSTGHARVWRLYQAFFLRQPDQGGFDHWYAVRARGAGLSDIAYSFSASREFQQRYGNLDHGRFVDLVYRNVLCRPADAEGRAYWTQLLTSGRLSRWDMVIGFVELREYLARTGTCHSIHPAESQAVAACRKPALRPLSEADLTTDGYQDQHVTVPRVNGGTGAFRGVMVDHARGVFSAGADRCAVASINANWVLEAEKDRANPSSVGLGVVDGRHVKGSADRLDRGILGLRFDATPHDVVEVWPGDTLSVDDQRLSSVLHDRGGAVIESWLSAAENSPYLDEMHPEHKPSPDQWVWAAAGAPLIIGGQKNKHFDRDYVNDPYTMQTLRHTFVASDKDRGWLLFGATTNLDARDLVVWAQRNGWEDLVKFDGGASTELNVGRRAVVAGTSRDLPVWLGIGC
jgi:Domain of unknown function (DUF4214)